jgi:hypothetical protein
MTYSAGGKIQSNDFNTRNGGTAANVSGQINSILATGNGNAGYGQSSFASNVSTGNKVNASNWSTLVTNINVVRKHQSGAGYSNLTVPASTNKISFISSLDSTLTDAYTNRLTATSSGSTTTGTNDTWNVTSADNVLLDQARVCRIQFSSEDTIRYFFNAGGKISMIYSAVDNAGNARSQSIRDVVNNIGGFNNYVGYSNSGRTGTGGTVTLNNTNIGYWNVTNTSVIPFIQIDDDSPYVGNYAYVAHWVFGSTTNGSNGNDLRLYLGVYGLADVGGGSVNITVTSRCDITFPSTTYLNDSWGTPTISYLNG